MPAGGYAKGRCRQHPSTSSEAAHPHLLAKEVLPKEHVRQAAAGTGRAGRGRCAADTVCLQPDANDGSSLSAGAGRGSGGAGAVASSQQATGRGAGDNRDDGCGWIVGDDSSGGDVLHPTGAAGQGTPQNQADDS